MVLLDKSLSRTTNLKVDKLPDYKLHKSPRRGVIPVRLEQTFVINNASFKLFPHAHPLDVRDPGQVPPTRQNTDIERASCLPIQGGYDTKDPSLRPGMQALEFITHMPRKRLGSGAFGGVSETVNMDSGDLLAVKTMLFPPGRKGKAEKELAKKEVLILSGLEHPNIIVFVHSQGWGPKQSVELFMKPCDGSLENLMRAPEAKDPSFLPRLRLQIFGALAYLQRKAIIHFDIKPDNILHNDRGKIFFLADFGLAAYRNHIDTAGGTIMYMAPEVTNGTHPSRLDCSSDIWSFGVTLLEVESGLPRHVDWRDERRWHPAIIERARERNPALVPLLNWDPRARPEAKECLNKLNGPKPNRPLRRRSSVERRPDIRRKEKGPADPPVNDPKPNRPLRRRSSVEQRPKVRRNEKGQLMLQFVR